MSIPNTIRRKVKFKWSLLSDPNKINGSNLYERTCDCCIVKTQKRIFSESWEK